ncbi:MAG: hypothetical protein HC810_06565 [Acaryochloridaceae cyanobacterium RL_2_7]|nr:hypothetical protein [Acaryochloridaceae cyanobacterium RL_2_7]
MQKIPPIVYVLVAAASFFGARQLGTHFQLGEITPEASATGITRSLGSEIFSSVNSSPDFQVGTQFFDSKQFRAAHAKFQASFDSMPQDPIPRIYAQNALYIEEPHLKIAAVVPLGSNWNVALEMLRGSRPWPRSNLISGEYQGRCRAFLNDNN